MTYDPIFDPVFDLKSNSDEVSDLSNQEDLVFNEEYENTFKGIIEKLYLSPGSKLEIIFSSVKEENTFTSQLYRAKKRFELYRMGIGMMEEDEVQSLRHTIISEGYKHQFFLGPKIFRKKWNFTIVDPKME